VCTRVCALKLDACIYVLCIDACAPYLCVCVCVQEEMQVGSYVAGRDYLRDTWRDLRERAMAIPYKLRSELRLLQTYLLARRLGKMGDYEGAARVLIFVAKNISKFPSHVVKILTSTVVMTQKAGLKRSSYEYACQLMQPEYRNLVDGKVRKRIEQLVRRPVKEEKDEAVSACPFCQFEIPESQLDCSNCKNRIPFCCATGKHMVLSDWTACPQCQFPALFTPFVKQIAELKTCPMCERGVQLTDIEKLDIDDAKKAVMQHGVAAKAPGDEERPDGPPPAFADGEAPVSRQGFGEAPPPRQGFA
jgi:WD repeat-containing protein 19